MDKEFYTKYSNDLDCVFCSWLQKCKDADEPVCVGGLLKHYKDQVKVLEKALKQACEEGHNFIIEGEGCWFGADSNDTFDWFDDLSKEEKIKALCEYFKNKAKEMLKDE